MDFFSIEYGHSIFKTPCLHGSDDSILIHQMRHPGRNDTVTGSVMSSCIANLCVQASHFGNIGIAHTFLTEHALCAINKILVDLHELVSMYR